MRQLCFLVCFISMQSISAQVLIKNVHVVDVENKKLLKDYSVLALDGKITAVEKDIRFKLTEGTTVIDGSGKYLIPGLTDAHVHFFQSGGMYTRPDVIDLRKYRSHEKELAWLHQHMDDLLRRYSSIGVTSLVDVGASFSFLSQRDSFMNKSYAPLIRMTGPLLTTYVPGPYKDMGNEGPFALMETEEGVRQLVRDQLPLHTDFIKIWYIVTDADKEKGARKNYPLVKAAIEEAHKHGLRVAVHATERITAQLAVEAGADFLVHSVDDEIVSREFVQLLKKNKTVLCPTLVVVGNYGKALGDSYQFSAHELNVAHPEPVASVINYPLPDTALAARYMQTIRQQEERSNKEYATMQANLKLLLAGGVTIATGTDAGNIGTQHAGSYIEELKAMQQAGMNLWQLLEASTINGAKMLGQQQDWGSIAKGKIANMVLLNKDPLAALENWQSIEWVISKGVAFKPADLIKSTPEMLAQQQLNAYNAHNLEAFLEPYADDVEIYGFPDQLQMKGKVQMREAYQFIEKTPALYCNLLDRIVQGNMVIDQEEVTVAAGKKPVYATAIYIVEAGKISKVYFKR